MQEKTWLVLALVAAAVVAYLPAPALAEEGEFRLSPYIWVAGFTGTLGVPTSDGTVPGWSGDRLDVTFGNLSDNLSLTGAAMLSGEWRKGRLSVFGDWVYVGLDSSTASSLSPLYTNVEGEIRGNIGQANIGWRLYGSDSTRLDAYGGVRYYDLEIAAGLTAGLLEAVKRSGKDSWVDGLVGLRLEQAITERWRLTLMGDVGAGGSAHAQQAIVTCGYQMSWGAIGGGWRLLRLDHTTDEFRLDATLSGPLLGATFRF
jgi:hypothetical protein